MVWFLSISTAILLDSLFIIITRSKLKGDTGISPTLKVFFSVSLCCIPYMLGIYALGLSESGDLPWIIAMNNPSWMLQIASTLLYRFFMLLALHFICAGEYGAISDFDTVIIFIGLIVINVCTGKFETLETLLTPVKLISLIGMIAGVYILNQTHADSTALSEGCALAENQTHKPKRRKGLFVIGLTLAFISTFFDATDSLIMDYILTDNGSDAWDYMIVYSFWYVVVGVVCWIAATVKTKKAYNIFAKSELIVLLAGFLEVGSDLADILAASENAVFSEIAWGISPVMPIALAIIFLKEKYTLKELICFASIIGFGMVFVVAEMVL